MAWLGKAGPCGGFVSTLGKGHLGFVGASRLPSALASSAPPSHGGGGGGGGGAGGSSFSSCCRLAAAGSERSTKALDGRQYRRRRRSSSRRYSSTSSSRSTTIGTRTISTSSEATTHVELGFVDLNPDQPFGGSHPAPVAIMHGLLGNSKNFQTVAKQLLDSLETKRRIFLVDMRNHGTSGHHPSMTYPHMAADVQAFLEQRGASEAVLVGHSMGGKIAAMTALMHPQLVKGLVVMDIAPVSYSVVDNTNWGETRNILKCLSALDLSKVSSRREADEVLAKDIVDPMLRAFALTNLESSNNNNNKKKGGGGQQGGGTDGGELPVMQWRIPVRDIFNNINTLAQFQGPFLSGPSASASGAGAGVPQKAGGGGLFPSRGAGEGLEGLRYEGDTLFVAGGESRYVRSQHLQEVKGLFPRYALQTVRGAGHWLHADKPKETMAVLRAFLDREEVF